MSNTMRTFFGSEGAGLFAMGSVVGARSWRITDDGHLRGVHYDYNWVPGENEARCLKPIDAGYYGYGMIPSAAMMRPQTPNSDADRPHAFGECTCGFYGYFDGSNDYYRPKFVQGVIEGYGHVVIGTRGFRCMKARVLALYIPADITAEQYRILAPRYADIPRFRSFASMVEAFPLTDPTDELTAPSR